MIFFVSQISTANSFKRDQNLTINANLNIEDIYGLRNLKMLSKWLEANYGDYINNELH